MGNGGRPGNKIKPNIFFKGDGIGKSFTSIRRTMMNGTCPFCKEAVEIKKTAKEGDIVICKACEAELEIVSLKPLELDWPLDDYEDDGEYDFDNDDDWDDD
jgi:lysine biosynthesis protein LysW